MKLYSKSIVTARAIVSVKRTIVIKWGMINNKQKRIDNTPEGLFHYTRTLHFTRAIVSLYLSVKWASSSSVQSL